MTLEPVELELDTGTFNLSTGQTCRKCGLTRSHHIEPVNVANLLYCPRVVLSRELAEMEGKELTRKLAKSESDPDRWS